MISRFGQWRSPNFATPVPRCIRSVTTNSQMTFQPDWKRISFLCSDLVSTFTFWITASPRRRWRMRDTPLSRRWDVKGVCVVTQTRSQGRYEILLARNRYRNDLSCYSTASSSDAPQFFSKSIKCAFSTNDCNLWGFLKKLKMNTWPLLSRAWRIHANQNGGNYEW